MDMRSVDLPIGANLSEMRPVAIRSGQTVPMGLSRGPAELGDATAATDRGA